MLVRLYIHVYVYVYLCNRMQFFFSIYLKCCTFLLFLQRFFFILSVCVCVCVCVAFVIWSDFALFSSHQFNCSSPKINYVCVCVCKNLFLISFHIVASVACIFFIVARHFALSLESSQVGKRWLGRFIPFFCTCCPFVLFYLCWFFHFVASSFSRWNQVCCLTSTHYWVNCKWIYIVIKNFLTFALRVICL